MFLSSFHLYTGIVPMFCDDVFKQIEAKKAEGDKTEFEVHPPPNTHTNLKHSKTI